MVDGTILRNTSVVCALFIIIKSAHSSPTFDHCFSQSASKYNIDVVLLKSVALQESSLNPNAINARSRDEDIGLMQINSFWFDQLDTIGITRHSLFEPCTSIEVGAWVLAQSIQHFGHNWRAVGAYNAGTAITKKAEKKREIYAKSVKRHYDRLHDRMQ